MAGRARKHPLLLSLFVLLSVSLAGCGSPTTPQDATPPGDVEPRAPFPDGAPIGMTRVFANVGPPGNPGGIAVEGNRVYVSSVENPGPGAILLYNLTTGLLEESIALDAPPEAVGIDNRGVFHVALDAAGRVYATQMVGARVVRFDPKAAEDQEVYAQIPDLPLCAVAPLLPCSPTATDERPWVNDLAFGPDGSLYVSDLTQATIFRVAPGGGSAEPWFQDPRFERYGPNGLAISPDQRFLYVAHSAGFRVVKLPLTDDPQPQDLEVFHQYPCCGAEPRGFTIEKAWGVDGIRFGASGRLYVTLLEANVTDANLDFANGYISVLASDGTEVAAFPSVETNGGLDVPYDVPADVAFNNAHRSILIPNLGNSDPKNWAVLEAFVDDTAHPLHRPDLP